MNKLKINNIDRSHSFGGHLNNNWITRDLPRYQLAYERLSADFLKRVAILQNLAATKTLMAKAIKAEGPQGVGHLLCQAFNSQSELKLTEPTKQEAVNTVRYPLFKSVLLDKIILHYNSGKLLQSPSNSTIIDLAFSTMACQTPTKVYSRKSIAGFKLSKFALLGAKTTLRSLAKYEFYYKFYFLGASQTLTNSATSTQAVSGPPTENLPVKSLQKTLMTKALKARGPGAKTKQFLDQGRVIFKPLAFSKKTKLISTAFAIKNVFVFNELDNLDYDAFSNLAGLEIQLVNRDSPLFSIR